ncbi:hypothetical protein B0W47_02190 [Komagataeibacter nataicola]|uniref:Uncharacterized protein n=1 Tax=Komagataeibacter nataicola TaxID=265960 RepID=A0A9N7CTR7_9PROT|nr:hypothetical protein [Komagataeibacter nataicola]AQU86455.1 hypothetical protein B0W47_02190 [Komagataeibacter nataicola]PYD65860.1 hypothetical protein CDI09_11355 [Komagataeibacter nataicola]WEQ56651.1 hypothetical protein LV564_06120 [Komagataeibacter nataicola]WNM08120.1 hypothetical protein RI056_14565 [Komagataeibacter nataicola]GBR19620.1 hypothetical protein AA0616_1585 [Komagataeibacter nataicola NRIC 0616]
MSDNPDSTPEPLPATTPLILGVGLGLPYGLVIGGFMLFEHVDGAVFGFPPAVAWLFACMVLVPGCMAVAWWLGRVRAT